MPTPYRVALITVPDRKTARKLTQGLLNKKLAACINIFPALESHYWWGKKIEKARELLLLIKTRATLIPRVIQFVKKNHPYTIPEVIALDIDGGNKTYLDWIRKNIF
ncbi:MAG: divalent-cation tolerance protein CutA [Elusimicrobia bacterium]|nr:divalent-cation tolerance protein CutA [Elusimicrobiota bacterium]